MTKLLLWLPLILVSAWTAWRLSKTPADPDWSVFNFWSMTGSVYGRDFSDCKTPAIHLWYLGISKIVGRNVVRIKFAHTFFLGATTGILVLYLTNNFFAALAATVLIMSPSLAPQGNVGQQPALFIIIALLLPDNLWIAPLMMVLAMTFEPKLVVAAIPMTIYYGWYFPMVVWAGLGALLLAVIALKYRKDFEVIWESSVTIPLRIAKLRPSGHYINSWVPDFVRSTLLFIFPWILAAVWARPDFWYWLPIILFMVFQATGKVLRWNHWIPVVAWIVAAQPDPVFVVLLVATEWVSSGFYLGSGVHLLKRYYYTMADMVEDGRKAGEWLKDKPGKLWVNGINMNVYIYAEKPVEYGMAEIIEVREASIERREEMQERWQEHPAEWVVQTLSPQVNFLGRGYKKAADFGTAVVWEKLQ